MDFWAELWSGGEKVRVSRAKHRKHKRRNFQIERLEDRIVMNADPIVLTPLDATEFNAGVGGVFVAPAATVEDDSANFDGGKLTVSLSNAQSGDDLTLRDAAGISVVDNNGVQEVWFDDGGSQLQIGTLTLDVVGEDLEVSLNADATADNVQSLVRAVAFEQAGALAGPDRSIDITLNDGDATTPGETTITRTIQITPSAGTNDAPVHHLPGSLVTDTETPIVFSTANGNAITVTDQDAGVHDITVSLSVSYGTLTLGAVQSDLTSISGDGTSYLDITGDVASINTALEGLTYTPDYPGFDSLYLSTTDNGFYEDDGYGGAGYGSNAQYAYDSLSLEVTQAPQPGISVTDAWSWEVYDGNGNVHFGSTSPGAPLSHTFTIHNPGTEDLTLANLASDSSLFTITSAPAATVAPGGSTTFTIEFDSVTGGYFNANITLDTNVPGSEVFNFAVAADAVVMVPEIEVYDENYYSIYDAEDPSYYGAFDFGQTPEGTAVTKTFYVENYGDSDLTLSGLTLPAGFSIDSDFSSTAITPYSSASFSITFNATTAGVTQGELSFTTNDADEGTFNFTIQAEATAPSPEIEVYDENYYSIYDAEDPYYLGAFDFGQTPEGTAVSKTFHVENHGDSDLTLSGLTLPAGFSIDSDFSSTTITPYSSASFSITYDATSVGLHEGELSFLTNDLDEATFNFSVRGETSVPSPEIEVLDNYNFSTIYDAEDTYGGGIYYFGETPAGTPVSRTFTVNNHGDADLALSTLQAPAGFSISSNFSSSVVAPNSSATFTISFDASTPGVQEGEISFATNDQDESTFNFLVSGEATGNGITVLQPIPDYDIDEDSDPITLDLSAVFSGGQLGPLTYSVTAVGNQSLVEADFTGDILTLSLLGDANGAVELTVRAEDAAGQFAESSFEITVHPVNDAPRVIQPVGAINVAPGASQQTIDLNSVFGDVEGSTLTFSASVSGDSDVVSTALTGNILELTFGSTLLGAAEITVEATDQEGLTGQHLISVAVNQLPVVANPIADIYIDEDDPALTLDIAQVFSDDDLPNGDFLTITVETGGSDLFTASVDSGQLTVTPLPDSSGSASLVLRATDSLGATATQTVSVHVNAVNDAPVIAGPSQTQLESGWASVSNISVADIDSSGAPLQVTLTSLRGRVSLGAVANLNFTVGDGLEDASMTFQGAVDDLNAALAFITYQADDPLLADTLTLTVDDLGNTGSGGQLTVTHDIAVLAPQQNNAPTGVADIYQTEEGVAITVSSANGLLANDTDADGDLLAAELVSDAVHGTVTLFADGSLRYVPDADYAGTDTFVYRVGDGHTWSNDVTVTLEVAPAVLPPAAVDDNYVIDEDQVLTAGVSSGVLANDSSNASGDLSVELLSTTSHGELTLESDGSFVYLPAANFEGMDTFRYKLIDSTGSSSEAVAEIQVNSVNDAPEASASSYLVYQGDTLNVDVNRGLLSSATDIDGDPLTVEVVQNPTSGSINLAADGSFTYVADTSFHGDDTFQFRVNDGAGGSLTVVGAITVLERNIAPSGSDDIYSVIEDGILEIDATNGLLANDSDVNGDNLSVILAQSPTYGALEWNADGSFIYRPAADFSGTDSFTYRVTDGNLFSALTTATINTTPVADAPTGENDSYGVNGVTQVDAGSGVLLNDANPDGGVLTATLQQQAMHGVVILSADGSFQYTPGESFDGLDSFTYTASNGGMESLETTVTLHAGDNNDVVNSATSLSLISGATVSHPGEIGDGEFSEGDVDIYELSLAAGEVVVVDVDAAQLDAGGAQSDLDSLLRVFDSAGQELAFADDSIDPETGVAGVDSAVIFQAQTDGVYYVVVSGYGNDGFDPTTAGSGASGSVGDYTLNISLNAAPVATTDSYVVDEDTFLNVVQNGVLENDSDAESESLIARLVNGPAHGELNLKEDGLFSYTPSENFSGFDTFTYEAVDEAGVATQTTATIFVSPVNDAPHANDRDYEVTNNGTLTVTSENGLGGVDVDGDQTVVVIVDEPEHGNLVLATDGSFVYTPDPGFKGEDRFTYRLDDGASESEHGAITIHMVPGEEITTPDSYTAASGAILQVNAAEGVLANDEVSSPAATITDQPSHGSVTLNADGSFTYTPEPGFTGQDQFGYSASSDAAVENSYVTIHVTDAAILGADYEFTATLSSQIAAGITNGLASRIFNPAAATLTFSVSESPGSGTLQLNADGTFVYDFASHSNSASFVYEATDGQNLVSGQVMLTRIASLPVAARIQQEAAENSAVAFDPTRGGVFAAHFTTADQLSDIILSAPEHGAITVGADGWLTYTPVPDFSGQDTFTYRAGDEAIEVDIEIASTRQPVSLTDYYAVRSYGTLNVNAEDGVLQNDRDLADNLASLYVTTQHGDLSFEPDGSFTYTPESGFSGEDEFFYYIDDGSPFTGIATRVVIRVFEDAPVAREDQYELHHGETLSVNETAGVLANEADYNDASITAHVVTPAAHGTLSLETNGAFTYTAAPGYTGEDSFTYHVKRGDQVGEQATVTFKITNLPPVARPISLDVSHGTPLTLSAAEGLLAANPSRDNDPLTVTIDDNYDSTLVVNADGSLVYTPHLGFTGEDVYTYTLSDGSGETSSATLTFNVVNTLPQVRSDNYEFTIADRNADGRYYLSVNAEDGVLANDADPEGNALTAVLVRQPGHGNVVFNTDGSFVYTADAGYAGQDRFSYRVNDGAGESTARYVYLHMENSAPEAVADNVLAIYGQSYSGNLLANDVNEDAAESITITSHTAPRHGALSTQPDGSFTYTPDHNFAGEDSFTYTISDGYSYSTATVNVTVQSHRPDAVDDHYIIREQADGTWQTVRLTAVGDEEPQEEVLGTYARLEYVELNGSVLANDTDIDLGTGDNPNYNENLFASQLSSPDSGSVEDWSEYGGTFTFRPDSDESKIVTFRYETRDNAGLRDEADVVIFIEPQNKPPVLESLSFEFQLGRDKLEVSASRGLLSKANDAESNWMEVIAASSSSGDVAFNADGSFDYTPASPPSINDSHVIHFTVRSGTGALTSDGTSEITHEVSGQATVTFTNQTPEVEAFAYKVQTDAELHLTETSGLAAFSSDGDADDLTFHAGSNPANGVLELNENGSFTYSPNPGFVGEDSFSYFANDGFADSGVATVTIEVLDGPVVANNVTLYAGLTESLNIDARTGVLRNDFSSNGETLKAKLKDGNVTGATLNEDGSLQFDAVAYLNGAGRSEDLKQTEITVNLTYVAYTDSAPEGNEAVITIKIANIAPVATEDIFDVEHSATTLEIKADQGLLINDYDLDSPGQLSAIQLTPVDPNSVTSPDDFIQAVSSNGETLYFEEHSGDSTGVALNPNGSFTYTIPDLTVDTTSDEFWYYVTDGFTFSDPTKVTINFLNTAPEGSSDVYVLHHSERIVVENGKMRVHGPDGPGRELDGLLANDFDYEDYEDLEVQLVGQPPISLVEDGSENGLFEFDPAGPSAAQIQQNQTSYAVQFQYNLFDGLTTSEQPIKVFIYVTNQVARGNSDIYHLKQGEELRVDTAEASLLYNDSDWDGDTLTAILTEGPVPVAYQQGKYEPIYEEGSVGELRSLSGHLISPRTTNSPEAGIIEHGKFAFSANDTYTGVVRFKYVLWDGMNESAPVEVLINVTNELPVTFDDYHEIHPTDENGATVINLDPAANDQDRDGDSVYVIGVRREGESTWRDVYTMAAAQAAGAPLIERLAYDGGNRLIYTASQDPEDYINGEVNHEVFEYIVSDNPNARIINNNLVIGDDETPIITAEEARNSNLTISKLQGSIGRIDVRSVNHKPQAYEDIVTIHTPIVPWDDPLSFQGLTPTVFPAGDIANVVFGSLPVYLGDTSSLLSNDSDADNDDLTVTLTGGNYLEQNGVGLNAVATTSGVVYQIGDQFFYHRAAESFVGSVVLDEWDGSDEFTYVVSDGIGETTATVSIVESVTTIRASNDRFFKAAEDYSTDTGDGMIAVEFDVADLLANDYMRRGEYPSFTANITENLNTLYNFLEFVAAPEIDEEALYFTITSEYDFTVSGLSAVPDITSREATFALPGVFGSESTLPENLGTITVQVPVDKLKGNIDTDVPTFNYRLSDGLYVDSATVDIHLTNVAPKANDGTQTLNVKEDGELPIALTEFHHVDPDGGALAASAIEIYAVNNDSAQNSVPSLSNHSFKTQYGTLTANFSGSELSGFTYKPDANFHGEDHIKWFIRDPFGTRSDIAILSINVTPTNDDVEAEDDFARVTGRNSTGATGYIDIDVLANDVDPDGPTHLGDYTIELVGAAAEGVTTSVITTGAHPKVRVAYTAEAPSQVQFSYRVIENVPEGEEGDANNELTNGVSGDATITVEIPALAGAAPVAHADSFTLQEDEVDFEINLLSNDTDDDDSMGEGSLHARFVSIEELPTHGTLRFSGNGVVHYTPDRDFNGTDSFTYRAYDNEWLASTPEGNAEPASGEQPPVTTTVNLTVTPVADNLSTNAVEVEVAGASRTISKAEILAGVKNPPAGAALSVTGIVNPGGLTHGTVTASGEDYVYTRNAGETGSHSATLQFTVVDGLGGTANVSVNLRVLGEWTADGCEDCAEIQSGGEHTYDGGITVKNNGPGVISVAIVNGRANISAVSGNSHSVSVWGEENRRADAQWTGPDVTGDLSLSVDGELHGDVTAGGTLSVTAGKATGNLKGGSVDYIEIGGQLGSVESEGDITSVNAASLTGGAGGFALKAATNIGNIYVTGDISSKITSTGGYIHTINAGGDITGNIDANKTVGVPGDSHQPFYGGVHADGDISGNVIAGETIYKVNAKGSITSSEITSTSGDIIELSADRDISATNIKAHNSVYQLSAGRDINSIVTAENGDAAQNTPQAEMDENGNYPDVPYWSGSFAAARDLKGEVHGKNIGTLTAGRHVDSTVDAQSDIDTITAGADVKDAITGDDIDKIVAGRDIMASITANGDLGELFAKRDLTSTDVTVSGFLTKLKASRDFTANVSASKGVETIDVGRNFSGETTVGASATTENGTTVYTPQGATTAGVEKVDIGLDLTGEIISRAGIGISGSPVAGVQIGQKFSGVVKSLEGHISFVHVGSETGALTGFIEAATIEAKKDIDAVAVWAPAGAGGNIGQVASNDGSTSATTIVSKGGGIGSVTASGSIHATIRAHENIGEVRTGAGIGYNHAIPGDGGDIAGSIRSVRRSVEMVFASGGDVSASVTAFRNIGEPGSGYEDPFNNPYIDGELYAYNDPDFWAYEYSIGGVYAHGDITGDLSAKLQVTNVWAAGDITGNIVSKTDRIGSVHAGGSILSEKIFAGGVIGSIWAIGDIGWLFKQIRITSKADASRGISRIISGSPGQRSAGSIFAKIESVGSIDEITAYGSKFSVDGGYAHLNGIDSSKIPRRHVFTDDHIDAGRSNDDFEGNEAAARIDALPRAFGGSISGSIVVTKGGLGKIVAYGDVSARISSVGDLDVWTLGTLSGNVTASQGKVTLTAWGAGAEESEAAIQSKIKAHDGIFIYARGDVAIDGVSETGSAVIDVWGDLRKIGYGLDVGGAPDLWVFGKSAIDATTSDEVFWLQALNGLGVHVNGNDVVIKTPGLAYIVSPFGGVQGQQITTFKGGLVWISAGGDIEDVRINTGTLRSVVIGNVENLHAVTHYGAFVEAYGNITQSTITVRDVSPEEQVARDILWQRLRASMPYIVPAVIATSPLAPLAPLLIPAYIALDQEVVAKKVGLDKPVSQLIVDAIQYISKYIDGAVYVTGLGGQVDMTITGRTVVVVTGDDVKGSYTGEIVDVTAHEIFDANVNATRSANVKSLGDVNGEVISKTGSVSVNSAANVDADILAQSQGAVSAWGYFSGDFEVTKGSGIVSVFSKITSNKLSAYRSLSVTTFEDLLLTGTDAISSMGSVQIQTGGKLKTSVEAGGDLMVQAAQGVEVKSLTGGKLLDDDIPQDLQDEVNKTGGHLTTWVRSGAGISVADTITGGMVKLNAHGDISLGGGQNSTHVVAKREDVDIFAGGSLQSGAKIVAAQNVAVRTLATADDIDIKAGGDFVSLFAGQSLKNATVLLDTGPWQSVDADTPVPQWYELLFTELPDHDPLIVIPRDVRVVSKKIENLDVTVLGVGHTDPSINKVSSVFINQADDATTTNTAPLTATVAAANTDVFIRSSGDAKVDVGLTPSVGDESVSHYENAAKSIQVVTTGDISESNLHAKENISLITGGDAGVVEALTYEHGLINVFSRGDVSGQYQAADALAVQSVTVQDAGPSTITGTYKGQVVALKADGKLKDVTAEASSGLSIVAGEISGGDFKAYEFEIAHSMIDPGNEPASDTLPGLQAIVSGDASARKLYAEGRLSIFAGGSITAISKKGIEALGSVHVAAGDGVDANISAGKPGTVASDTPELSVTSGGGVKGKLDAYHNIEVQAKETVDATITSISGGISVTAGATDGAFTAHGDIKVVANNGNSAAQLGSLGAVTVSASNNVSNSIAADGGDVNIYAGGGVTGSEILLQGQNVSVTSAGNVNAVIHATSGNAAVLARKDVIGSVDAITADVTGLGSISADITTSGATSVIAGVNLSGDVNASVPAGDPGTSNDGAPQLTIQVGGVGGEDGAVSGAIVSALDVVAIVEGDFTSNASVESGGNVVLAVSGVLSGSVEAGVGAVQEDEHSLVVVSQREIASGSSLQNHAGGVGVFAAGKVDTTISAAGDVIGWNVGNGSGETSLKVSLTGAVEDVLLSSLSGVDVTAGAVGVFEVSAQGDAAVDITGTAESVGVSAYGDATLDVTSADKGITASARGSLISNRELKANAADGFVSLTAGRDVTFTDIEGVKGVNVTALGNVTGGSGKLTSASGPVVVSSWGSISGLDAEAANDIRVSALNDLQAKSIKSTGGAAFVSAGGALQVDIESQGDTAVQGLGTQKSTVTVDAGGDATVLALGDLNLTADAGGDIVALSQGDLNATVTAAAEVLLTSFDDLVVDASGVAEASFAAFGDLNANVVVTGDIASVYARGNLRGSLTAGGDIGQVDSSGFAHVTLNGEVIESVTAWDGIQGSINATQRIGQVRSAATIAANLVAPQIDAVVESDTQLKNLYAPTPVATAAQAVAHSNGQLREITRQVLSKLDKAASVLDYLVGQQVNAQRSFFELDLRPVDAALLMASRLSEQQWDASNRQTTQTLNRVQWELEDALKHDSISAEQVNRGLRDILRAARSEVKFFLGSSAARIDREAAVFEGFRDYFSREKQATVQEWTVQSNWWKWSLWLDRIQFGVDILGFLPVIGDFLDIGNGAVYYLRGRKLEAALSMLAAIPLVGSLGKFGGKGVAEGLGPFAKNADELAALAKAGREGLAEVGEDAAKVVLRCDCVDDVARASRELPGAKTGCFVAGTPVVVGETVEETIVAAGVGLDLDSPLLRSAAIVAIAAAGAYAVKKKRKRKRKTTAVDQFWAEFASHDQLDPPAAPYEPAGASSVDEFFAGWEDPDGLPAPYLL